MRKPILHLTVLVTIFTQNADPASDGGACTGCAVGFNVVVVFVVLVAAFAIVMLVVGCGVVCVVVFATICGCADDFVVVLVFATLAAPFACVVFFAFASVVELALCCALFCFPNVVVVVVVQFVHWQPSAFELRHLVSSYLLHLELP